MTSVSVKRHSSYQQCHTSTMNTSTLANSTHHT